jgi:signal transduction histidine kinase
VAGRLNHDGQAPSAVGGAAALHGRLARTVVLIYLGAAAVAIGLLVAGGLTDMQHDQSTARDTLLLDTETRASHFGRELGLLAGELRRLGLRSEINLLDESLEPEESLLRLSHEKSTFFNVGVAIVDRDGTVLWSLPDGFMPVGRKLTGEPWFTEVQNALEVQIVPISPEGEHNALLYLVAPIIRNGAFSGALIGGIDLSSGGELAAETSYAKNVLSVLATRDGTVVYPTKTVALGQTPSWRDLFVSFAGEPFVRTVIGDKRRVVAADSVPSSDLVFASVIDEDRLDAPSITRLWLRLSVGAGTALVPLVLLILFLRRTLRTFGAQQEAAARDERLKLIGEAANLIAHEIKNSLNGLQIGLDFVMQRKPGSEKTIGALKSELQRLSSFTTKLLTFSKGVVPRPKPLDLSAFVVRVVSIYEEQAAESKVELDVDVPETPIAVHADAALFHVFISNLVGNAIDALAVAARGHVKISLAHKGGFAVLRAVDDGPGVSAAVRAKLFEPFVTGKPSGVGIGLALSRKIARAHGGDLVLEPTATGASFLFTLPIIATNRNELNRAEGPA